MAITTQYDAKVNLTVAKEALAKGKTQGRSAAEIKKLTNNVRNAEQLLAKINKALAASKKR